MVCIDFLLRVSFNEFTTNNKNYEFPELTFLSKTKQVEPVDKLLYASFDIPKKDVPKPNLEQAVKVEKPLDLGIGKQKEIEQNGSLSNLFSGNNESTLVGVFFSGESFAIVAIKDLATNQITLKKIKHHDTFFGYRVDSINVKSINLSRDAQKIELKLFTK